MTEYSDTKHILFFVCFMLTIAVRAEEMPNPAAVFCDEQGGNYDVVREAEAERRICFLPDGREVDAWDYFRGYKVASPVGTPPAAKAKPSDGVPMAGHKPKLVGGWTRQD